MKRIRIQNLWLNSFTVAAVIATIIVIAMPAVPATKGNTMPKLTVIKGESDTMTIDNKAREIRITATITKDCSKPSVCDWGRRGQAFFGSKGGKAEPFFIFATDINRPEIDKAVKSVGMKASRQLLNKSEVDQRTGLKPTTLKDDYLDGDPVMVVIRYSKGSDTVETAIEEFIEEKIIVDGKEVIKPYTPHFVYHGSGEAISYPSGCVVCPSGCYGGIIADNSVPLLTTSSYFRFNWDKMPAPGSKVELILKSVYGKFEKKSK